MTASDSKPVSAAADPMPDGESPIPRLSAELAYFLWEHEVQRGMTFAPSDVAEMYAWLLDLDSLVSLSAEDMLYVAVMHTRLSRCHAVRLARHYTIHERVLALLYLSQTQLFDEPISKDVWLSFLPASRTWDQFVHLVLRSAAEFDFDTLVTKPEMLAMLDELDTRVAMRARDFYTTLSEITADAGQLARESDPEARITDADFYDEMIPCDDALDLVPSVAAA